jgi:sterol 3beta-glucosyltransferase
VFIAFANEVLTLTLSWFLDNPELNWTPPKTLDDFMVKARSDGKPLVYIGFGSITVPNPKLVTERLIRAVLKSTRLPTLPRNRS